MRSGCRRVGLMGGTFDPIHHGHLLIAEVARTEFELDQVVWLPAGTPPHKRDQQVTPAEHRYAMVVLATASNPYFEVSRQELERQGASYTVDTVESYRQRDPECDLFFITGADAILEILTWHRHHELVRQCRFIAVTRPGYDLARLKSVLPPHYVERIETITAPGMDISSTAIRERVRKDDPVRYLIPESVEAYLRKHALYRT